MSAFLKGESSTLTGFLIQTKSFQSFNPTIFFFFILCFKNSDVFFIFFNCSINLSFVCLQQTWSQLSTWFDSVRIFYILLMVVKSYVKRDFRLFDVLNFTEKTFGCFQMLRLRLHVGGITRCLIFISQHTLFSKRNMLNRSPSREGVTRNLLR